VTQQQVSTTPEDGPAPVLAYVALGANLGDARQTVLWAISQFDGLADVELVARSHLYRTEPVDASGPDFINAVVAVMTRLSAHALLHQLQHLEQLAGRQRPYRHAPRTLDLDLLLYGNASISSADLMVPHPRMYQRAFVLVPLAEIAPQRVATGHLRGVQSQRIECLAV